MNRPKAASIVRVAHVDNERAYLVAECGCVWVVEDALALDWATELGTKMIAAFRHIEKGEPCFVPSGVTLTAPPTGQLSVDQGVCQNSAQEGCAHG